MDFVAIDFETANENRNSACSLGITVVKENKIVEKFYTLIKPKKNIFKPMNIWIHGISAEDVEKEKTFKELWPIIKKYLENNLIVAHNAYFDIEVLINTLKDYNLEINRCLYLCTVDISKIVYKGLPNNKLVTLAEMLEIEFKHHNAEDDSMIAASIFIDVCNYLGINKLSDISKKLFITPGLILSNVNIKPQIKNTNSIIPKEVSLINKEELNNTDFFRNKTVVFTGPLKSLSRAKASNKVLCLGGFISNRVSNNTDILITNLDLNSKYLTNKLIKTKEILESGKSIKILSEKEFLKLCDNRKF